MTAPSRPFVDLHEAVRVVMRLMPDSEHLAAFVTDDWIALGYREWNADNNPVDDPHLTQPFGPDWRGVRPRVFAAYWRAIRVLEKVLPSGRVGGFGVSAAASEKGQQPIEAHEWASRWLDVRRNLLATPAGKKPEHFPAIRDVLVSVEDLERECDAAIAAEDQSLPGPDLKSVLRKALQDNRSLTQTEAEKIGRSIATREEIRSSWKTLGGSSKPGPKGPRKNRAAPSA
jgi:hypothetical protein